MQGGKKIGLMAVLVLIIVVAAIFGVKHLKTDATKPPQWYLDRPIERIDSSSFEVITKSYGEWLKLGEKDGRFKNPTTGAYTMAEPIVCASCGVKVPSALVPGLPKNFTQEEERNHREVRNKAMRDYRCPKCGKAPYAAGSF